MCALSPQNRSYFGELSPFIGYFVDPYMFIECAILTADVNLINSMTTTLMLTSDNSGSLPRVGQAGRRGQVLGLGTQLRIGSRRSRSKQRLRTTRYCHQGESLPNPHPTCGIDVKLGCASGLESYPKKSKKIQNTSNQVFNKN